MSHRTLSGWNSRAAALALALTALVAARDARAQWGGTGIVISQLPGPEDHAAGVDDGAGGAFVIWQAYAAGVSGVWAQHLDASGHPAMGWPAGGQRIVTGDSLSSLAAPVPDGAGGVLIAYAGVATDTTGSLMLRRIPAGETSASAPLIFDAGGVIDGPIMTIRPGGGAFIAWKHGNASGNEFRVLAIDPTGQPIAGWNAGGIPFAASARRYDLLGLAPDPAAGIYALTQAPTSPTVDLYLCHVDIAGTVSGWPDTGVVVRTGAGQQSNSMVASGSGVIVTWWDNSNSAFAGADVFAQRFDSSGQIHAGWPAGGVKVCGEAHDQVNPLAVPDGADGAFILWWDSRNAAVAPALYTKRILASGATAPGWAVDGNSLSGVNGYAPSAVPNGSGGLYASWTTQTASGTDVFIQLLRSDGSIASGWPTGGLAISAASGLRATPSLISLASGDVIGLWLDGRQYAATDYDVYANRWSASGPVVTRIYSSAITLEPAWPNPANGAISIPVVLAAPANATLEVLDSSGRLVRRLLTDQPLPGGRTIETWDAVDEAGRRVRPGVYFLNARSSGTHTSRRVAVLR
jgi:hypothetical protein